MSVGEVYRCKGCGWEDEDEMAEVLTITTESPTSTIKDGDTVCESCLNERVCGRCGSYDEDSYGVMICEKCHRSILGVCGCVAVCWCQATECICKDCIGAYKDRFRCEKCNISLLEDLSGEWTLCEDAHENVLCMKCGPYR